MNISYLIHSIACELQFRSRIQVRQAISNAEKEL